MIKKYQRGDVYQFLPTSFLFRTIAKLSKRERLYIAQLTRVWERTLVVTPPTRVSTHCKADFEYINHFGSSLAFKVNTQWAGTGTDHLLG